MGFGIRLEVWGDYALFSRPEMKVERVSYDVITPSAARGIIEAIYWKPAIQWVVDRILVINPIRFTSIRRNEVKSKISAKNVLSVINGSEKALYLDRADEIVQRASLVLRDVRYVIEAHFRMTDKAGERDDEKKHYNIALRRIQEGQCFHHPYLGCREFPAFYRLADGTTPPPLPEDRELGWMLYDMEYTQGQDISPVFFRAQMKQGVIEVKDSEVAR